MYESFHIFSCRTFRYEVTHSRGRAESWPIQPNLFFYFKLIRDVVMQLSTQIAYQIPAREPVCLQAHAPRLFGAHIHDAKEIITFQMLSEKRLLFPSHVISDFGAALERGSRILGGSHEGRQRTVVHGASSPRPHRSRPCGHRRPLPAILPPLSLHAIVSPSGYH